MLSAQTDSSLASIVSLFGVGLLYLLFFRSLRRTLILLATVTVADLDYGIAHCHGRPSDHYFHFFRLHLDRPCG